MTNLVGERLVLRALEDKDLDFLYHLENDTELWEVSGTTTPYSRYLLKQYLDNAHRDIYEVKQLRLCIVDKATKLSIGLIDLFEFDPKISGPVWAWSFKILKTEIMDWVARRFD